MPKRVTRRTRQCLETDGKLPNLACPYCGYHRTKVKDSRGFEAYFWRRRACLSSKCGRAFTTTERAYLPSRPQ
jgi:DNA-directed RNA polymerase subunit RPC12/RpoP